MIKLTTKQVLREVELMIEDWEDEIEYLQKQNAELKEKIAELENEEEEDAD